MFTAPKKAAKRPRSLPDEDATGNPDPMLIKSALLQLRVAVEVQGKEVLAIAGRLKQLFTGRPSEECQAAVLEIVEMPPTGVVKYDVHAVLAACGLPDVDSTDEKSDDDDEEEEEEVFEELDKKTFVEGLQVVVSKVDAVSVKIENMAERLRAAVPCNTPVHTAIPDEKEPELVRQNAFVACEDCVLEIIDLPQPHTLVPEYTLPPPMETQVPVELESQITPREQVFPAGL